MGRLTILFLIIFSGLKAQDDKALKNSLLVKMSNDINNNIYEGVNSVIISKGNTVLYEKYFNGFTKDSIHDSRSSFKSITSLLIGIAIDKGFIKSVNQNIYEFFPENQSLKTDLLKSKITIKDLLEMRSGIDCEEFNETKICEEEMSLSKDWVKFSLDIPMKIEPGKEWSYSSVNTMICSGIIAKATGMSVVEFAKKYLFEPLGILNYKWTIDPTGNAMTAGSFYILPADMLKIGQLIQKNGVWNDQQIVSEKWINLSTKCDIIIPEFSFMKSSRSKIGIPQPAYYGFYWYRELLRTKNFTENLLFASGNGGQYIFIIKDMGLTVVFTQQNYGSYKAKQAFEILAKYIIPAVKKL